MHQYRDRIVSNKSSLMAFNKLLIYRYVRFTGNKQKSNEEFLLANRSMSVSIEFSPCYPSKLFVNLFQVLPVAFSLMASFMSAITL